MKTEDVVRMAKDAGIPCFAGMYVVTEPEELERFAALVRAEAIAEQPNLNCPSVQARLAAVWGYVKAEPTKNQFNPDWDVVAELVEENKRLAMENEKLRHGEINYEDWKFNPMTGVKL